MRPKLDDCIFVDFETETTQSYSLRHMSTASYVSDRRFRILSCAVAVGTQDVRFFHAFGDHEESLDDARRTLQGQSASGKWLVCHNANFDALVLSRAWDIEFDHVFDTADYARHLGLGASLDNVSRHLGLRKRSAPSFTIDSLRDATSRYEFARYNCTDVALCRRVAVAAIQDRAFPDVEFDVISMTARNNLLGLRVDQETVGEAIDAMVRRRDAVLGELNRLGVNTNVLRKPAEFKQILKTRYGINAPTIRKTDTGFLNSLRAVPEAAALMKQRRRWETYRRTATRLQRFQKASDRIHGFLRYYGAHTGRFTAGGRDAANINIHSLPNRAKAKDTPEVALLRTALVPEVGHAWVAGDLVAIEARVLAFLAGQEELVERYRAGEDVYAWFAQQVFPGVKVAKGGPNGHLRDLAKTAVLGLGYGMGFKTFAERVWAQDPHLPEANIRAVYDGFQNSFPEIGRLRKMLWKAFTKAVDHGFDGCVAESLFGREFMEHAEDGRTATIRLPTGRTLYYRSIIVERVQAPWGMTNEYWYCSRYQYDAEAARGGGGQMTKKRMFPDGRMRELLTQPTLTENIVQAVARDVLVHQMLDGSKRGVIEPVFHVHDELVGQVKECCCREADAGRHRPDCAWKLAQAALKDLMSRVPSTLSKLAGLPLACEMNERVRSHYSD